LVVAGARAADPPTIESSKPKERQDSTAPAPAAKPSGSSVLGTPLTATPDSATVEKIMEQAVRNISRRYNLNQAQTQKTSEIMTREVHKFLREHESEVWPVIRDLLASQLGAKPPESGEDAKRIGKAARPLFKLAKEAILRGNEEWRMYLTPEQKRMHDYDLTEMDKTFEKVERSFSSWEKGDEGRGPLFPDPPPPNLGPARPKLPPEGLPEPEVEIFRPSLFETFVEEFIKKYQLDKGQIDSARSILTEFSAKAEDFKNSKKDELRAIAADLRAAHEQANREKLLEAEAARKKLLEPIYELFGQMNERLMALLTTAQLERYAAGGAEGKPVEVAAAADEKAREKGASDKGGGAPQTKSPADSGTGTPASPKKRVTPKKDSAPEPSAQSTKPSDENKADGENRPADSRDEDKNDE